MLVALSAVSHALLWLYFICFRCFRYLRCLPCLRCLAYTICAAFAACAAQDFLLKKGLEGVPLYLYSKITVGMH
jgi:hypothetical protein